MSVQIANILKHLLLNLRLKKTVVIVYIGCTKKLEIQSLLIHVKYLVGCSSLEVGML